MIRNAALAFVLLAGTAHAQGAGAGIVGTAWLVEDIAGRGVIDSAQTTLSFDTAGRVSGSGGCNRFTGAVTLAGEALTVGLLAATRRACVPALMDQEQKFFKAIEAVRSYFVDANGLLYLNGANGEPLLRLVQMATASTRVTGTVTGTGAAPTLLRTLVFACGDVEFLVRMGPGEVELVLPDRTVRLPQVAAASGTKYQEGHNLFWNRGNEARIEVEGKVYPACTRQPDREP